MEKKGSPAGLVPEWGEGGATTSKKCLDERRKEERNEQNTCLPRTPLPRLTREQSLKIELASIRPNTLSSGIREKTERTERERQRQRASSDKASLARRRFRKRRKKVVGGGVGGGVAALSRAVQGQKEDLETSGGSSLPSFGRSLDLSSLSLSLSLSLSRGKSEGSTNEDGNAK